MLPASAPAQTRRLCIEYGARADNNLWIGTNQVGHQFQGSGYSHRDLHDRYTAAHDCLCEVCIIARRDPDSGNDGDFSNSGADFILRHFSEPFQSILKEHGMVRRNHLHGLVSVSIRQAIITAGEPGI